MIKNTILKISSFVLVTLPSLVSALTFSEQPVLDQGAVDNTLGGIYSLIIMSIRLMVGIAVLVFIWGMVKFIANANNEESRKQGRQFMIWGLIALVVISLLGAIIYSVSGLFLRGGSADIVNSALRVAN
jgi:hypothetical protein